MQEIAWEGQAAVLYPFIVACGRHIKILSEADDPSIIVQCVISMYCAVSEKLIHMSHRGILGRIAPMSVSEQPVRPVLERLAQVLMLQREPVPSDSKKLRGAVAVLIKKEDDELWLLMIKRRENPKDPWSGQMAFPGGHSDTQDRTLFDTVRRETIEEVGIDLSEHRFLGCLPNVQTKNAPMIVSPFVFLELKKTHPTTSPEATEIVWVPVSFLANPKNVSSVMLPIGGVNVLVGSYNYSNRVIWGMSFRMIQDIISIMTNHAWRHGTQTAA